MLKINEICLSDFFGEKGNEFDDFRIIHNDSTGMFKKVVIHNPGSISDMNIWCIGSMENK